MIITFHYITRILYLRHLYYLLYQLIHTTWQYFCSRLSVCLSRDNLNALTLKVYFCQPENTPQFHMSRSQGRGQGHTSKIACFVRSSRGLLADSTIRYGTPLI